MKNVFLLVALSLLMLVSVPVLASGGDVTNDGVAPVTAVDGLDVAAQHVVPVIVQAHETLMPSVDTPENRFIDLESTVLFAQTFMSLRSTIGHDVLMTFKLAHKAPSFAESFTGKRVWDNAIKFTS